MQRIGGLVSLVAQQLVIVWMNDVDSSDVFAWMPIVLQGGFVYLLGDLHPITFPTAVLGAVTAKNRASASPLLSADLGSSTAALQGMLLENTTHPSIAWIDSVSGTSVTLSQPMAKNVPVPPALYQHFPPEVDTTSSGDSFLLWRPTEVPIAAFEPKQVGAVPGLSVGSSSFMGHLRTPEVSGSGLVGVTSVHLNTSVFRSECRSDAYCVYHDSNVQPDTYLGSIANCWDAGSGAYDGAWISGGAIATLAAPQGFPVTLLESNGVDGDCILHGLVAVQGNGSQNNAESLLSLCYLDGEVDVYATLNLSSNEYHARGLYGKYTVNIKRGGTLVYSPPASGAGGAFLGIPTLSFTGITTAWSVTAASPAVWSGSIPLTPANLDAPAGAAGFGGRAIDLNNGVWIGTGIE